VVSRESIPDMKLQVVKVKVGESVLELLEPQEGEGVLTKFLGTRGEGIHHICLEVDDIRGAIRELRAKGYSPLWEEPKIGAGGKWVTFLRPKETFGVLLELNQDREGNRE